jgi:flagellin-like hook-associated protein FlgL
MEAVVRGLAKQIDNGADLISLAQVEDAALGHLVDVEQRVRELLVQRASDLLTDSDRDILDGEIAQMEDEVADTLKQTEFNTIPIFGPLFDDPALVENALAPERLTLEGVDALLEFLNRQRVVAGTRARTLGSGVSGDQIAQVNTLFLADQTRLLARLLQIY